MMMRDYNSAVLSAFLLVAFAGTVAAQPCPPAVVGAAGKVAALDGLVSLDVPCEQLSGEALEARLREELARGLDAPLELEVEALLRIGVLDGDDASSVSETVVDFFASQVLGFYDTDSERMVVASGLGGDVGTEMVLAHELEHAAQDVRFGLPRRVAALAANGDAQRAAAAVAEGEAILVMVEVTAGGGRLEPADLDGGTADALANLGALTPDLPGVPRYLVAETLFPYTAGTRLLVQALRQGGWPAVEELMRRPPLSTEQILHPERRWDPPRTVGYDSLPVLPEGFVVVHRDVLGEWGLRTWLEGVLPEDRAASAAAGWDGDLLRVSRRNDEEWRLDWVSLWDRPADAEEAAADLRAALPTLLTRLGPEGADIVVRVEGERLSVTASSRAASPVK